MKTQKQVQKDIDTLMEVGNRTSDTKEKNRIRKRLQFLRPIRLYMEHDPTEESVSSQLRHCLKKIDRDREGIRQPAYRKGLQRVHQHSHHPACT